MSRIEERILKDGRKSYRVSIRRKNIEIYKTFLEREDAELYSYYKEKLIDNMNNFDVEIKESIRISDLFELKINTLESHQVREIKDFGNSLERISLFLGNKFLNQISFNEWLECAKSLINIEVYRGSKSPKGKRKMSMGTLRKIFAHASSCISYAKTKGIVLDNHPLKVIQCFINA